MNIKGAFISWPVHINSLPQVPEAIMITGASILLLAGVLANDKDLHWQNEFDKPLEFTCPLGQSISGIESEHRNKNEDRRWNFACQATFDQTTSCATSPFINDFDEPFTYQCPYNQVITGMSSYHDNKREDRRWKFTCCGGDHFCTDLCGWTNYVNCFDEAFTFEVPPNSFLVGVSSYHENHHEDRRWKYRYCTMKKC